MCGTGRYQHSGLVAWTHSRTKEFLKLSSVSRPRQFAIKRRQNDKVPLLPPSLLALRKSLLFPNI